MLLLDIWEEVGEGIYAAMKLLCSVSSFSSVRRAAFALDMDFITSEEQYAAERAALEAWTAVNIDVAYRELVLNTQKSRARRLLSTLSGARVARGL